MLAFLFYNFSLLGASAVVGVMEYRHKQAWWKNACLEREVHRGSSLSRRASEACHTCTADEMDVAEAPGNNPTSDVGSFLEPNVLS